MPSKNVEAEFSIADVETPFGGFRACSKVAPFPAADLGELEIVIGHAFTVERLFQHQGETAGLGINANRAAQQRFNGCTIRRAYQTE